MPSWAGALSCPFGLTLCLLSFREQRTDGLLHVRPSLVPFGFPASGRSWELRRIPFGFLPAPFALRSWPSSRLDMKYRCEEGATRHPPSVTARWVASLNAAMAVAYAPLPRECCRNCPVDSALDEPAQCRRTDWAGSRL